jgi:5-methyltetrahydropteroyltriglutamate--homocysteine methyltransferase
LAQRVWTTVLGGYHRPRYLRHALRDVERGTLPFGEAEERVREAVSQVVGVQVASGMRYVVDGMLDWHDIFRPFVESWRNVYPDGLLRYFDNNFFYRIPVFREEPEPSRFVLAPRVKAFRHLAEPAELKVVVPGPLTLVLLSKNESGLSKEELAISIARILNMELRLAVEAGAGAVQVDEPILSDPYLGEEDLGLLGDLIRETLRGVEAFKMVATYFGVPGEKAYRALVDLDVDAIALPLTEGPKRILELLKRHGDGGKVPILGVVEARNIYDDDYQKVLDVVREATRLTSSEEVGLSTSAWLDLIPFTYSLRKTVILGLYAESVARELGLTYVSPSRIV